MHLDLVHVKRTFMGEFAITSIGGTANLLLGGASEILDTGVNLAYLHLLNFSSLQHDDM